MSLRTALNFCLFVAIVSWGAVSVSAQPGARMQMDPAELVERMLRDMEQHVGISAEQVDELRPIFVEQGERQREIFEQFGRGNREAMRAGMDVLRAETNELVGEVLNEEQMANYLAWQETRPRGPRGRQGGNRPLGSGE